MGTDWERLEGTGRGWMGQGEVGRDWERWGGIGSGMPQLLFQDRRDMKRASVGLLTHY